MSNTWDKIKTKAIVSSFFLLSLMEGSVKSEAKTPEYRDTMNMLHTVITNNNKTMTSYSESVNVSLNNKMYVMSNDVCLYDIGNGYSILREKYETKGKQKMFTHMLSPDGRKIDINFCNTDDFMLPSYLENNRLTEVKNDPVAVKKNNDKWEAKQHILAIRKIKVQEDREAFMRYVKQTRDGLENGTFPDALMREHKSNGFINNYFVTTNASNNVKQLRKLYKDIKKQAKETRENIQKGIQKGNISFAIISNLQSTND